MGYKAVTGEISYTRASRVPMKPVAIIGVKNGKYEYLETWLPK
jgi:branched-chain amino acid transport system substrate-binding protein